MDIGAIVIIMFVACILVLTFYIIGVYNKLIDAKNRVEDKFKQIDLEFKKRTEIIPNLVDIVSNYTKHEKKILTSIMDTRKKMIMAKSINEKIDVSSNVCNTLENLNIISKTYPKITSNKNFISLKKELKEIEEKINYASSFYNDAVLNYNNLRKQFPSNIIANIFKLKEIKYLNKDK